MKLAVLVAALVALCSIAALAADTWKQEGDNWYCYDKDGNMVYGEAKKSGSNYYYLDEATGAMVKNKLVDNGDGKYYYGEDGARVVGAWAKVEVENDDDGWEYMYFQPVSGKAVVNYVNKTINGKKYTFNTDGYMVYGLLDGTFSTVDNASEASYYYSDKTDGSAQTGWLNIKDGADANYSDDASIWFYFKNGAKITDKVQYKVASGKKYNFAMSDGKLITGWAYGTDSHASHSADGLASASYYGGADEGQMVKKQWIKTDEFTAEDTNKWYYLDSDGLIQGFGVAKINGKYYLFNSSRQMVSGAVAVTATDELDPKSVTSITTVFDNLDQFEDYEPAANEMLMYFSADGDTDGSMKTGTQTVTIDGESATVVFDKHGFALEGISSKKIYVNGILQAAGDDKVAVKKLRVPTSDYYADYYLVNAAGSILKNTKQVNADGIYYVAKGDYSMSVDTYKIYKFADKTYASNAATALLKDGEDATFKISDTTYELEVSETATNGVYTVTW